MAILARSSHCGCCGNTVWTAVPMSRWIDGPASCRPLTSQFTKVARIHIRRRNVKRTRMCPFQSCSGGKWTNSRGGEGRRRSDAVPMALYTNLAKLEQARKQGAGLITDSQISETSSDLFLEAEASTNQELRLGVAGKSISHSKLLRVGVDVDEVLGNFLSSLNTFIAEEYLLQHNMSEYYVYDFMKIWNCSQTEANDRVHAFFESEHFNSGIIPIPGAYQTLRQLASDCHLVVVTSRQHVIRQSTMDWINLHYEGLFKEVHFGNHFALEGEARSKSEICRSLGIEVLIDDNPRYAMECADHGIEVLLFDLHGDYPWSKTAQGPTHPLITRVHDWSEVEQALRPRFQ
ncbi:hypothetical protein KC19_VG034100 [Ceratodon purpureus]|uniref:Uncharacterized protein n=1 Tax=Ceratodon purpureus TaxID=3225 RepID=A0A8T0HLJ3_CERPU|nr:hypothetical protein KC19_VG034100 [Ceratodon purpureus]